MSLEKYFASHAAEAEGVESKKFHFFREPPCAAAEALIHCMPFGLIVELNRLLNGGPCEALWVGGWDGVGWWLVQELLYCSA